MNKGADVVHKDAIQGRMISALWTRCCRTVKGSSVLNTRRLYLFSVLSSKQPSLRAPILAHRNDDIFQQWFERDVVKYKSATSSHRSGPYVRSDEDSFVFALASVLSALLTFCVTSKDQGYRMPPALSPVPCSHTCTLCKKSQDRNLLSAGPASLAFPTCFCTSATVSNASRIRSWMKT